MKKIIVSILLASLLCACSNSNTKIEYEKTDSDLVLSYIELAESYVDAGDIDKAIEVLEKGFTETADKRLNQKLSQLIDERTNSKPTTNTTIVTTDKETSNNLTTTTPFETTLLTKSESIVTSITEDTVSDTTTSISNDFSEKKETDEFEIVDGILIKYIGNDDVVVVPNGVTQIGSYAFFGEKMSSVILPEGITYIGLGAFASCKRLTSINVPDGVQTIDSDAFGMCECLKSLYLPDSIIEIKPNAFEFSPNLTVTYKGNTYTNQNFEELYQYAY